MTTATDIPGTAGSSIFRADDAPAARLHLFPWFSGSGAVLSCLAVRLILEPGAESLGWAPFAQYGLTLVQALAIYPANLLFWWALSQRLRVTQVERWQVWLALLGVGLFRAMFLGKNSVQKLCAFENSMGWRLGICTFSAAMLQAPWCSCAALCRRPRTLAAWRPTGTLIVLATTAGFVLPWMYANYLIERESRKATELLEKMELARARPGVVGLAELGSTQPIGGQAPREVRRQLEQRLAAMSSEVERPLQSTASPADKVDRARLLAMLDRPDAATKVLEGLTESHVPAMLLTAGIFQDQKMFTASDVLLKRALALLRTSADMQSAGPEMVRIYDNLAFNARATGKYAEAEAFYFEAMRRLPPARAHFHFQLGRHYHLGGRPTEAMRNLRIAVSLTPSLKTHAAAFMEEMTRQTPGCLFGPGLSDEAFRTGY